MKLKKIRLILALLSLAILGQVTSLKSLAFGQEEEFRGVWVSTVYNLDFPSKSGLSEAEYKKEYLELLDNVEDLNLNTIIFQVRPKSDAFYASAINPWSEYLSLTQGDSPGWDPLSWMIDEAHKRNLEFHAWLNPYRVTSSSKKETSKLEDLNELSEKNWARLNPSETYKFDGKVYLNPASPKVLSHLRETVAEIIENYDVDAIHFDDYFYPNLPRSKSGVFYPEEEAFYKSNTRGLSLEDWRRDNINKLIIQTKELIDNHNQNRKKYVEFGVSPFGIWDHIEYNPLGSKTPKSSMSSYGNQFADSKKWVNNNWVDYIIPQIYWTFDEKPAPYGELVAWWSKEVETSKVKLYIGHGNYKKAQGNSNKSWDNPREIINQLNYNKNFSNIKGSCFFKYTSLLKESNRDVNKEFLRILSAENYANKIKHPAKIMSESQFKAPIKSLDFKKTYLGNLLTWIDSDPETSYYLVYKQDDKGIRLIDKVRKTAEVTSYLDRSSQAFNKDKYLIKSVSSNHIASDFFYK